MTDTTDEINHTEVQRKLCERDVEVPTIITEPLFKGGRTWIFVQWFADISPIGSKNLELWNGIAKRFQAMQFRFPVVIDLNDEIWMGKPELFKVVLLGQGKDLRGKSTVPHPGKDDDWVVWLASSYYGTEIENREVPISFSSRLGMMPSHRTYGLITPRKYYNPEVYNREEEAFGLQARRWSLRSLNG